MIFNHAVVVMVRKFRIEDGKTGNVPAMYLNKLLYQYSMCILQKYILSKNKKIVNNKILVYGFRSFLI